MAISNQFSIEKHIKRPNFEESGGFSSWKEGFFPRIWFVRPDGARTLVPAREKNLASHEIWDDDGAGFSWCGGGVYHHNLATDKQECWVPDAQAVHNTVSPDKKYVVYDVFPGKWWRGCPWNVKFYNRETKRAVEVYSTRPALCPENTPSLLHPDPHPQFVCKGRYVVSTANNAYGNMELFITPVDQLVTLTTVTAPPGGTSKGSGGVAGNQQ